MTDREAQDRATKLGLSAWVAEAVAVGRDRSETVELRCVGFVSAGLAIAEAETWEEALDQAARIIFRA
jgi:hypothetical protein